MRILHLAPFDPANVACSYDYAMRELGHRAELMVENFTNVARHGDVWPDDIPALEAAFVAADVVFWHLGLQEGYRAPREPIPGQLEWDISDREAMAGWIDASKSALWIHGSRALRSRSDLFRQRYARHRKVVSTPDLLLHYPDAFWAPVALLPELDQGEWVRHAPWDDATFKVHHAPTNVAIKNTAEFQSAASRTAGVEWQVIQGMPYRSCLMQKAMGHANFDHMQGYYGANAIEALAMGQVSLVGADAHCRQMFFEAFNSLPPFEIVTTEEELAERMGMLAAHRSIAQGVGEAGRAWFEAHFRARTLAERLIRWLRCPAPATP